MLGLTMKSGENIIDICDSAMARINRMVEVEQALPRDVTVRPVSKLADNVSAKIDDVISNVISAIVIVVIVVFLFVGLRTSLVMAANIPFVVLGSIAIISLFGVELEQISLASIIIALGLLVDNAVQVCDQTRVNILDGMSPREAAVEGARTLMLPMLTGTLTTVAAFLPMLFALTGGAAEYVYSLPVTLSTTLLLSWIFAMSFCVLLAAAFIRAPKNPDRPSAPLPWLSAVFESNRDDCADESNRQTRRIDDQEAKPCQRRRWKRDRASANDAQSDGTRRRTLVLDRESTTAPIQHSGSPDSHDRPQVDRKHDS
jgi:multidrug efflux pump subunit AcrB